jgi:hypothetical protein
MYMCKCSFPLWIGIYCCYHSFEKEKQRKMESPVFSSHLYILSNLILDHFQLTFNNIKDTKAPHEILSSFVQL